MDWRPRADPDVALAGLPEPVLLDEWQAVPGVLGAVKRAIDSSPRHGRFIVTGSSVTIFCGPAGRSPDVWCGWNDGA